MRILFEFLYTFVEKKGKRCQNKGCIFEMMENIEETALCYIISSLIGPQENSL